MVWVASELLVLAAALALDAAAVTAALAAAGASVRTLVAALLAFGAAQAAMAGLGGLGGVWLADVAGAWDHWIAFGLLAIVGGRMVLGDDDAEDVDGEPSVLTLAALAIATSIDALAAGVTLPVFEIPLVASVTTIGVVTSAACGVAGAAGRAAGTHVGAWALRAAGVVLVLIGLRVLVAHLTTGV